ncbi:MAG: hypothetical protein LBI10_08680 [Deltaproteobacteria bacterium]|nr:hypothetical protein [Deltaproteobacteria bacterium]
MTKRSRGRSLQTILSELSRYFKGWLGYYKIADLKSRLAQLDGWVRRRLRDVRLEAVETGQDQV